MTTLFPALRAAEDFDSILNGTASQAVTDRHAALLETVELLRTQPEVMPRATFVADLRDRLMTAAESEFVPAPPVARRHAAPVRATFRAPVRIDTRRRRLGSVAAALVIVTGSAGMAAAASGALPGDSLYPIKRGAETLGTAVRIGDASTGRALLGQAENRLGEASDLLAAGSTGSPLVVSTLDSFRNAANQGSDKLFTAYQRDADAADVVTVRRFAAAQMAVIAGMAANSDATTIGMLIDAADSLADIDQQARVLCGECGTTPPVAPPASLAAGAAAASLDNLITRPIAQAQTDIEAATLAELQAAAERQAGEIPKVDPNQGSTGSSGTPSRAGPLTSTITGDGELLPSLTTGAAVTDFVTGVTGTLAGVTGDGSAPGTLLGSTKDGLTSTVDKVTGKLNP